VKLPHLIVHECNTNRTRVKRLSLKNKEGYADLGRFVMESMAAIVQHCTKQGIKPCMHVIPRQLTKEDLDKIEKADWGLEAKELIHAVERGEAKS